MGFIDQDQIGFEVFGQSTPKQVAVGITSTSVLATNLNAVYRHIRNNSSVTVFLQYSNPAALNQGIRLCPGAMLVLTQGDLFLGPIHAIAPSPTVIDVVEGV